MGFNTVGQYSATHKPWDHAGNIIPDVEKSQGDRPYGEFKPAAWLPVQFYDKYYEDWITCTPGKIVSFDPQGRMVPAQYMLGSSTVTYTSNDVNAGVIDVRNGNACTSGTVSASPITLNGLSWMGTDLGWVIRPPAGVAPYAWLQWAGDGSADDNGNNPIAFRQHNYNRQSRASLLCDYLLELPLVPASQSAANITRDSYSSNVQTFNALSNLPVAANTVVRTPIVFADGTLSDSSTRFVNQVVTAAEVTSAGDWYIDLVTGVVSVYAAAELAAGNIYTCAYYHYASAPATVSVFASVVGNPLAGDFLKSDSNSNWTVATSKVYGSSNGNNFDTFSYIMGQVVEVQTQPQDYLDRVRTAWASLGTDAAGSLPGTAGQMDQMPGSATGGVSDKVHYAGAANLVALVNMVSR